MGELDGLQRVTMFVQDLDALTGERDALRARIAKLEDERDRLRRALDDALTMMTGIAHNAQQFDKAHRPSLLPEEQTDDG